MRILSNLPFSTKHSHIESPTGIIEILPYQIVIWTTLLTPHGVSTAFPAILDTGLNQSFALSETHLEEWAGLRAEQLKTWGKVRVNGRPLPLKVADIGLYYNVRGASHRTEQSPYRLMASEGVIVYPKGPSPRLPLLGLRALVQNKLRLSIDGTANAISLRSGWWF